MPGLLICTRERSDARHLFAVPALQLGPPCHRPGVERPVFGVDAEGAGEMFRVSTLDLVNAPINEEGNIDFDKELLVWNNFSYKDEEGIIIVKGDFKGDYVNFKKGVIPEKGSVLVTPKLYPEIGEYIKDLKGIICETGAYSSHIAILSREYNIPLKIQVSKKLL